MAQEQLEMFQFETPTMPKLDKSRCNVRKINFETASDMVRIYHYAHRVPSISWAFGLYVDNVLAGCITFGSPPSRNVQTSICGTEYADLVLELNRLFIHDWAGRNSESWLIGQAFNLLPQPAILVSYADSGQHHLGTIYQATNWIYGGCHDPGNYSRIEIDGQEYASKSMYDALGSQGKAHILKYYPNAIFHKPSWKHRYCYFLGNKDFKKKMKKHLKWDILPYPKPLIP